MRIRKVLFVFVTILLVLPSFLVSANSNDSKSGNAGSQEKGNILTKDEVVYAKLSAEGKRQEIYVVNILNVDKSGEITDYGPYSNLKNLTDLSSLEQKDEAVTFTAPEGRFYYQGNLNEEPLPWEVSVSYLLNGKDMAPEEIAGKDGHVQIRIETSANENVNPVFFQNYLLQISLSLNLDIYRNIEAPDGMLANAGKNKQVTFTVMPEKEEELILEADVVDFELDGIDITAIPSSLPVDAPDLDDMTGDMETLTKAIKDLNSGVSDLNNGVQALNSGAQSLRNGSGDYQKGISELDDSSSDIVKGSQSIEKALETLSGSLDGSTEEMDFGDLIKLQEGLLQMAGGLKEASGNLTSFKEEYSASFGKLTKAIEAIPDDEISEDEKDQLYNSGADPDVLKQLLDTYSAAGKAKEAYLSGQNEFGGVVLTLENMSNTLTQTATQLETMASEISTSLGEMDIADSFAQLKKGIDGLSSNYKAFHSGLVDYTGGVSQLASSYQGVHQGIEGLSNGTAELEKGVTELHDGTEELYKSTHDLPDQMKKEVDQMMDEYDKSDFEAVSFVSQKNAKINSVQFVFKTESIKQEEQESAEQPTQEEKGFWARLIDLF